MTDSTAESDPSDEESEESGPPGEEPEDPSAAKPTTRRRGPIPFGGWRGPQFPKPVYWENPVSKLLSRPVQRQLAEFNRNQRFFDSAMAMSKMTASITSPLSDVIRQLNKSMAAQWLPIIEAVRATVQQLYPPNWGDARPPSWEVVEEILVDEGIPLMWVPGPEVVKALFEADSASARRRVIGRRWKRIVHDCETALNEARHDLVQEERGFALDCVRALQDGHTNAAQALAASLLDTALTNYFDANLRKKITGNWYKETGVKFDFDDYGFRAAFTLAPVWCAHAHFFAKDGDPVPTNFGRHPSVHAVTRKQYTRINAVIALMIVTSLIRFANGELVRRGAPGT